MYIEIQIMKRPFRKSPLLNSFITSYMHNLHANLIYICRKSMLFSQSCWDKMIFSIIQKEKKDDF